MTPIWRLEFWGGTLSCGKFAHPWSSRNLTCCLNHTCNLKMEAGLYSEMFVRFTRLHGLTYLKTLLNLHRQCREKPTSHLECAFSIIPFLSLVYKLKPGHCDCRKIRTDGYCVLGRRMCPEESTWSLHEGFTLCGLDSGYQEISWCLASLTVYIFLWLSVHIKLSHHWSHDFIVSICVTWPSHGKINAVDCLRERTATYTCNKLL